jgi:REP element-mobilizing transposase RayT
VYNRVSRGEHVFRNDEEADRLEELLAITKKRDDFKILAWCVMSNHYHLAVRMGDVALSRSMRTIHQKFAQSFNGRHRVFGPFWQGRNRSKYVDDDMYLRQLVGRSTCGFCDGQIKGKGTIEQNINTPAPGTFTHLARLRWDRNTKIQVGRFIGGDPESPWRPARVIPRVFPSARSEVFGV